MIASQSNDGRKGGWKRAEEGEDLWKGSVWFVYVRERERDRERGRKREREGRLSLFWRKKSKPLLRVWSCS